MSEFGITVSMKPTPKYDSPMIVFKGENEEHLRSLIEDFFDLDSDSDATTDEMVHNTDAHLKALWSLGDGLGASPTRSTPRGYTAAQEPITQQTEHVWGRVLQQIADATTTDQLRRLFATNKTAWDDTDVQAAATARAEELT